MRALPASRMPRRSRSYRGRSAAALCSRSRRRTPRARSGEWQPSAGGTTASSALLAAGSSEDSCFGLDRDKFGRTWSSEDSRFGLVRGQILAISELRGFALCTRGALQLSADTYMCTFSLFYLSQPPRSNTPTLSRTTPTDRRGSCRGRAAEGQRGASIAGCSQLRTLIL